MKRAAALLSLACLSACFPDYDVVPPRDMSSAGSSGTGGTGMAEPTCKDEQKNGDETGIDCGMQACGVACPVGQGCATDIDCRGVSCANLVCQAASCHDNLHNDAETDKDCGGDQGCDRCKVGDRCKVTSDCDGGACANGQCQAPTCQDELANGDETDQDCGGSCDAKCAVGRSCATTEDCDAVACGKGKCQPASCEDAIVNQDETDQDCGGACETKCDTEQACKVAGDCASSICTSKKCVAPSCTDTVKNGDESGKDCGGACPSKCKELETCNVGADCENDHNCVGGRCVPSMPNGTTLVRTTWIADASTFCTCAKPQRAVDGQNETDFNSGADQTIGMYFQVDMRSPQVVFSIEIDCNDQNACLDPDPTKTDVPAGIEISFSDTESFEGVTPAVPSRSIGAHEVIKLNQPAVGRYMRITLTEGKDRWWRMDELRLKR